MNQMKKLMEMHRMVEPAIKDLCVRLWPSEPVPSNYFSLVAKLCYASARIDVVKCSMCIEGAHMAFTKTMVHGRRSSLSKW